MNKLIIFSLYLYGQYEVGHLIKKPSMIPSPSYSLLIVPNDDSKRKQRSKVWDKIKPYRHLRARYWAKARHKVHCRLCMGEHLWLRRLWSPPPYSLLHRPRHPIPAPTSSTLTLGCYSHPYMLCFRHLLTRLDRDPCQPGTSYVSRLPSSATRRRLLRSCFLCKQASETSHVPTTILEFRLLE